MPSLKSLLRALPPQFAVTLADVGSAGGLKDRWQPAASRVHALLFEPRDAGAPVQVEGANRIFPVALADSAGARELHITAMANMSSLLEPNAGLLGRFRKKGPDARVTRRVQIPVDTLDALLQREGLAVDALKVDTQGSELSILQGATRALADSVVLAEVEISFIERYVGQALAHEVMEWMHSRGFELVEIYRLKRYRWLNSLEVGNVGIGGGHRAGQLAYGDAVFVAGDALLQRRWSALDPASRSNQVLALLISLLVYGKADTAAAKFDTYGSLLEPVPREAMHAWLRRWRRAEYGRRGVHIVMDYLARKI